MAGPALRRIARTTRGHKPRFVEPDLLHLRRLGLYVRVEPDQGPDPTTGLYMARIYASESPGDQGIGVTTLGFPPNGIEDAVADWWLGVLPVLIRRRGITHPFAYWSACGRFKILYGGVILRGQADGGDDHVPSSAFFQLLYTAFDAAVKDDRPHWIECWSTRFENGKHDVSCRLDNEYWEPGMIALRADIARWPGSPRSFESRRQFLLINPVVSPEPPQRSFWSRLLGKQEKAPALWR